MFNLRDPQGRWSLVRFYGPEGTWIWDKSSVAEGWYTVQVCVRTAGASVACDRAAAVDVFVSPQAAPVLVNPGDQFNDDGARTYARGGAGRRPVAYWPLGEPSGAVAIDGTGFAAAIRFGAIAGAQPGALSDGSSATLFNGANSFVRVTDTSTLQLAGDLSLELWLKLSLGARQTLLSKHYLHDSS